MGSSSSTARPASSWTATIVEPSQSQRCASTLGASTSSTVSVPKPISGHSRRRRIRRSNQFSSDAGSRRSIVALTWAGPNAPSVTGRTSRRASAVENPPLASVDHCIGERTAMRPSIARFSPMPISSP